jgi:thiol:disulfide interchange protein/DsbC/DsbD-like thiol-disulfide interchange protein
MRRLTSFVAGILTLTSVWATAQGLRSEPVFRARMVADRAPAVAGTDLRLAVEITIDPGWHINSDEPGDEFSIPTEIAWQLPESWPEPTTQLPEGKKITFEFSESPIEVWEGTVVAIATLPVPADAMGAVQLKSTVTAQACNNTRCLPPLPVEATLNLEVAAPGSESSPANAELFAARAPTQEEPERTPRVHMAGSIPVGVIAVVVGLILMIVFRPGPFTDRVLRVIGVVVVAVGVILIMRALTPERAHLKWQVFEESRAHRLIEDGRPVILDFMADWCLPCRELDEQTFSNPEVAKVLGGFERFKVNLTQASPANDAIRQAYGALGVPTVVVFDGGKELFRITGFVRPGEFLKLLGGELTTDDVQKRLAGITLPAQIVLVFLAGLALNLTPCVYPLIPITVGFFAQQAKERSGGTFGLAVTYVLGISVTYSVLGVVAAMTGQLFGSMLQSPIVVGIISVVLIGLAASMFGLWELRVPAWAMRGAGGRSGAIGALIMGFMVGFVAAPCIGPFVLGLLTYVGQRGSALLGFVLFFALSMGLGFPYLLLGTFTGAVNRLPASGAWMLGIRKVFGVILVALAVYFLRPLVAHDLAGWLMASVLAIGGAYLLVVERTGHQQPAIDRIMRVVCGALIVVGATQIPNVLR